MIRKVACVALGFDAPRQMPAGSPRGLRVLGGDETGTYQRLIQYRYGTVSITAEEHRLRESLSGKKKRKKK